MMTRRRTQYVVVHCSATPPSTDIGKAEIDRWHRQEGYLCIGYHFVIRRDGTVEPGRDIEVPGAHARGVNAVSVGICLVGGVTEKDVNKPESNYTQEQWSALKDLLTELKVRYPWAEIIGHRDVPKTPKHCPCFDVKAWVKKNL